MKADADKSPKEKKINLIITVLRFVAITAAGITCIALNKMTFDAGTRLLIFFAAAELIIQSCLQKLSHSDPW